LPTVSILIPTYEGARHIGAALDSVLSQDGVDLEIIITDDNSRDDTLAIVGAYRDPRIRVERSPVNLGAEANWNRALGLARGPYIKLFPQDDLLLPGSLAEQVAIFEADRGQDIALVFGARQIIGNHGRILARRGLKGVKSGRVAAGALARRCVRSGTNVIGEPGGVLFRRALAERIGGFDGAQPYVIDLDYWLRLLAHGDAWYVAEPVCAFRVSGGSWSVAIGTRQSRQYGDFLDRMQRAKLISASRAEMAIGKINARINNVLRLIFYKLVVR
jgi:glycosyltransferase involved in cell wall biosynthesis